MIEELPQEIVLLRQLCEANANTFCNEQMSTAIKFAEDTFNELIRLKEAIYPGIPKFVPTPEKPQEDFYILYVECLHHNDSLNTAIDPKSIKESKLSCYEEPE